MCADHRRYRQAVDGITPKRLQRCEAPAGKRPRSVRVDLRAAVRRDIRPHHAADEGHGLCGGIERDRPVERRDGAAARAELRDADMILVRVGDEHRTQLPQIDAVLGHLLPDIRTGIDQARPIDQERTAGANVPSAAAARPFANGTAAERRRDSLAGPRT